MNESSKDKILSLAHSHKLFIGYGNEKIMLQIWVLVMKMSNWQNRDGLFLSITPNIGYCDSSSSSV